LDCADLQHLVLKGLKLGLSLEEQLTVGVRDYGVEEDIWALE